MGWRFLARLIGCGCAIAVGMSVSVVAADQWAQALFYEQGHDFGPVPRGAKVRHNFEFTNSTGEIVSILDVRASCGCTTGRALTNTLQPGQTGVIEAEMDTRNFVGVKATTLIVTLVDARGRQSEARLGVRSNILSDTVLNPGSLDFGVLARGQSAQLTLTIDRLAGTDWRIERMYATRRIHEYVDASLQQTYRNAQGIGYRLTAGIKPDAPVGLLREEIRLVTNDPETPVVPVMVTVEIRGRLAVSPSLLALGTVSSAGGPVQARVVVRGAAPFRITAIEGNGDGFQLAAASEDAPRTVHILAMSFQPDQSPLRGDLKRTFRVVTDLAGEAPVEIQVALTLAP